MLLSYPIEGGLGIRVEVARIDAAVAIAFKDRIKAMTEAGTGRVVLDLGLVSFVDSSGLGAIVGAMKQLPQGRTLELAGLTPAVERVFRLTRMDTVFRIHRDAAAAGAAMQQAS
jgi:anti-sigma B factor antagonist